MASKRIKKHPILKIPEKKEVEFFWNGKKLKGYEGEPIAAALFANGIHIFGHHPKDGSPQGIFCANGQCSQCLVIADGFPVKACMTLLKNGMAVESVEGLPRLPEEDTPVTPGLSPIRESEVLIIGAGPAGLAAAIELGKLGVDTLLIDDKARLGGKLVLQTHKFFGSVEDSYAGERGYKIAELLERKLKRSPSVRVWLNTTAVGVFADRIVGVITGSVYRRVLPQKLLIAMGAREKMLAFPGNSLPGVFGAGAFQTLVNRDLVKPSSRVFIVGGGNVGLITGYHAIQAGIEVVGLAEAMPQVGGYKVHADKLKRLGVPIFTRHTVVSANGTDHVESVTIAALNQNGQIIPDSYKTFTVDTVLIAVGLVEVNELYKKAKLCGMDVFVAGDAQEIGEATAAMFAGKIVGLRIAKSLGHYNQDIPETWESKAAILKSKPGPVLKRTLPEKDEGVFPVFHCAQEIPCNPCVSVCPEHAIRMEGDELLGLPHLAEGSRCIGCLSCVAVCPGLAISLVDFRKNSEYPTITLPYEVWRESVEEGQTIEVTDVDGNSLGQYPVKRVTTLGKKFPGTLLVQIEMDKDLAKRAIGIRIQKEEANPVSPWVVKAIPDEAIICRCERVTAGELRALIRSGVRDMNQLKALTRAGMGACGSKTCKPLIWQLFREEGIDPKEVTELVDRPLFVEVPLGSLAGIWGNGVDE